MNGPIKLVCLRPANPICLDVQQTLVPSPAKNEVVVRVEACSVNPVDVKRATGYGRRLLSLKGAGRFPLVLGNDFAGTIKDVGGAVHGWKPGDSVFGLVPTGKRGAHQSYIAVEARWLRPAVERLSAEELSVFPYTFNTLWQALHGAGLKRDNARGKSILVHGASGGLGQLALQLLSSWGARVTAICSTQNVEICQALGAAVVWDRTRQALGDLPRDFDAGLNFGSWADEETLISCLKRGAAGYATTVHPLLLNFDRYGWFSGVLHAGADFKRMQSRAAAKGTNYRWIVFRPQDEALDGMYQLLNQGALSLPVGIVRRFSEAKEALDHVAGQGRGRAVLLPKT